MAKLTYYRSFQDLKTDKVRMSQSQSRSTNESELKDLLALLSKNRRSKDNSAFSKLSLK